MLKNTENILFESMNASFKLSINSMLTKSKQDGTDQNLVFVNQNNGKGTFRPSVFVVFTYLTNEYETTKSLWTSFPHVHKLRAMFNQIAEQLTAEDSFIQVEGNGLVVNPAYSQGVLLENIGKDASWMSIRLAPCVDEVARTVSRGVAIELSKTNGYSSLLNEDEFLSIVTMINDINLTTISLLETIIALQANNAGSAPNTYVNTKQGNYQAPQRGNYNNNYAPPTPAARPSYQTSQPSRSVGKPTAQTPRPAPRPSQQPTPVASDPSYFEEPESFIESVQPKKKVMNFDEIDKVSVPETDLNLDDSGAIDDLFNTDPDVI